MLVDMHLDAGDKQAAVELFGRCLTNCVTLDLWKGYMRYIHMVRARRFATLRPCAVQGVFRALLILLCSHFNGTLPTLATLRSCASPATLSRYV